MSDFDQQGSEELHELGQTLGAFLEVESDELSAEEQRMLSPILHSLENSRYHFTNEEFLISMNSG